MKTEELLRAVEIAKIPDYIAERNTDPFKNTPLLGLGNLGSGGVGAVGEQIVEEIMRQRGHAVTPRVNQDHDRIIDGIKTEIKFTISQQSQSIMNIARWKDWERMIILAIKTAYDFKIKWMYKTQFEECLDNGFFFKLKKGVGKDKWRCGKQELEKLFASEYTQHMDEWKPFSTYNAFFGDII